MSIKQISVFVESRPGHLKRNLDILRKNDVNVRGYMCSDTGEYGIARFIVDEPDRALSVFKEAGAAVAASDVVCLKLNDEPGELASVFGLLAEAGMNVSYSYSLIATYIALKVDDAPAAEKLLADAGVELVSPDDLA